MTALSTARDFIARMHWLTEERRQELIERFKAETHTEQDAKEVLGGMPRVIKEWEAELVSEFLIKNP